MKRAAIIGLGFMGSSLGMALRALTRRSLARRPSPKGGGWHVTGVGRDGARLRRALALGAADAVTSDVADGVREADVVILAVPVDRIIPLARKAWGHLKPGALVMDVGSVKGPIVRALAGRPARNAPVFIGAHPMCGSEKAGMENARADLYEGAVCAVTPAAGTPAEALVRAKNFWKGVGMKVLSMSPDGHDRDVAVVSHLPHLIAHALVGAARREGRAARLAAGSFRDATRVADADPALWAQIFAMNRPAVLRAVKAFQKQLDALAKSPSASRLSWGRKQHLFLGARP